MDKPPKYRNFGINTSILSNFVETKNDTSKRKDYIGEYFDSIEPYDVTLFQAILFKITCCLCCKRFKKKIHKLKARYHAA